VLGFRDHVLGLKTKVLAKTSQKRPFSFQSLLTDNVFSLGCAGIFKACFGLENGRFGENQPKTPVLIPIPTHRHTVSKPEGIFRRQQRKSRTNPSLERNSFPL